MSDVFGDTLAAAAENFFLLPGAETVKYYPSSGDSRQISAVVSRGDPAGLPGVDGGSYVICGVLVKNDAAAGISSEKIDTGGDKIELAKRVGETAVKMRITKIIDQDAGMMLLAVA